MAKEELPRGQLSNIILSILSDTDMYGYEIIETIKEQTNGALIVKQPSLYSCLRRMEEQNLISSYWRDSDIGGRRHYYSITDYGKKYAEKWQADLSIYKVNKDNVEDKEPNNDEIVEQNIEENVKKEETQETILQQTNLFTINKEQTTEETQEKEQTQKSFVQYDLFSAPTLISEPSDEVFDCIKKLRETADDENQISLEPEDKISLLRKEQVPNVEIKTTYIADSYNVNTETNSKNDVKKMFFELSKKQKSFANVLKENPETVITDDNENIINNNKANTLTDTEILNNLSIEPNLPNKDLYDTSSIFNQNDTNVALKNETDEVPLDNKLEEKPTIYQSTTEFKDTEDSYSEDSFAPVEFIDLNFENIETKIESNSISEEVIKNQTITEENITIAEPLSTIEEVIEEQPIVEQKNEPTPKDDAIYITEKPSDIPKVKKIAPARFEHITRRDSRIDEKVSEIYNRRNSLQQEQPTQAQYIEQSFEEEKEMEQPTTVVPSNDLDSLKDYYNSLNIGFNVYKKEQNTIKTNYVNKNKLNMITSISISALSIVLSIIMFCIFKDFQSSWNWLYIVTPICTSCANVYFIAKYITNRSSIAPVNSCYNYNWVYKLILSLVGIFVLFAINLLFGMKLGNMTNYLTTFVYISSMICLIPLSSLANFMFVKTGVANI